MPVIEGGGFEACWGSVIAALGLIIRRAFEEFERSKQPLETRTTTTRTRQTRHGVEVTETVTVKRAERVGDVRILKTLLQCLDREMRILKELHGDPKEFVDDLGLLSEEELEALDDFIEACDKQPEAEHDAADDVDEVDGAAVSQSSDLAVELPDGAGDVAEQTGLRSSDANQSFDTSGPLKTASSSPSSTSGTSIPDPAWDGTVGRKNAAAEGITQDALLSRLQTWLRETEEFLPPQPTRSPGHLGAVAADAQGGLKASSIL